MQILPGRGLVDRFEQGARLRPRRRRRGRLRSPRARGRRRRARPRGRRRARRRGRGRGGRRRSCAARRSRGRARAPARAGRAPPPRRRGAGRYAEDALRIGELGAVAGGAAGGKRGARAGAAASSWPHCRASWARTLWTALGERAALAAMAGGLGHPVLRAVEFALVEVEQGVAQRRLGSGAPAKSAGFAGPRPKRARCARRRDGPGAGARWRG